MNKPSAIALFVSAAFLAGATSESLPDRKQKNPGMVAPAASGASSKQDQSHDVHELEKISFTVTGVGATGPGAVTYLKGVTDADSDGDGRNDEAVLRVVCTGGAATEVVAWSWGATNADTSSSAGGHGRAAAGWPKEWGPSTPQLRALTVNYLKRKLENLDDKRMASDAGGWTKVSLSGGDGLCPAIDAVKATKSRSNIQNN